MNNNVNDNLGRSMDNGELNIDLNQGLSVSQNIQQECIVTTRDKLELVLIKTEKVLNVKRLWITPLSLLMTCVLSLISSDFKDTLNIQSSVWQAFFILVAIVCFVWLIRTIILALKNRKKGNIESIINQIKSESAK